jgi:hypothetical protein
MLDISMIAIELSNKAEWAAALFFGIPAKILIADEPSHHLNGVLVIHFVSALASHQTPTASLLPYHGNSIHSVNYFTAPD